MIPDTASVVGALTGSGDVCFGGEQQFPDSAPVRKSQARILTRRFRVRADRARMLASFGERPLCHFIDEIERGADLRQHLERYAALPAAFIKANGGDRYAPIVLVIDGGEP